MTPTQIHRISDKQPEFPCWLKLTATNIGELGWRRFTSPVNVGWNGEEFYHFWEWAPDQPSAPTATPPTEQATEGEREAQTLQERFYRVAEECCVDKPHRRRWLAEQFFAIVSEAPAPAVAQGETPFRGAFPVRAGHCKPDEIVVLKSQFDGVADKLDTTLRELNAAKLEQCRVELKYDQRVEECIRLRQQLAQVEKERDEARGIAAKAQDDLMVAWEKLAQMEKERDEARALLETAKTINESTHMERELQMDRAQRAESELAELRKDREPGPTILKKYRRAYKALCEIDMAGEFNRASIENCPKIARRAMQDCIDMGDSGEDLTALKSLRSIAEGEAGK